MWTRIVTAGAGLAAIFGPMIWPNPPWWVTYPGFAIGIILILVGITGFGLERIWDVLRRPKKLSNIRDFTAWQTLDYLLDCSEWGCGAVWRAYHRGGWDYIRKINVIAENIISFEAADELIAALKNGEISMEGQRLSLTDYENIDRRYWENYQLAMMAYWEAKRSQRAGQNCDSTRGGKTEPSDPTITRPLIFLGLRLNKAEVEGRWPSADAMDRLVVANMGIVHG